MKIGTVETGGAMRPVPSGKPIQTDGDGLADTRVRFPRPRPGSTGSAVRKRTRVSASPSPSVWMGLPDGTGRMAPPVSTVPIFMRYVITLRGARNLALRRLV